MSQELTIYNSKETNKLEMLYEEEDGDEVFINITDKEIDDKFESITISKQEAKTVAAFLNSIL